MPKPYLALSSNEITGGGDGISVYGATIDFLEPENEDPGNSISGVAGEAIVLNTWSWGTTPASAPGTLVAGPSTTIGPAGTDCIWASGIGVDVQLTGTKLTGCSSSGLFLVGEGVATVSGAVILDAGNAGLRIANGVMTVDDGTTISGSSAAGLSMTGGVVLVDGLSISGGTTYGLNLDGGQLTVTTADIAGTTQSGIEMSGGTLIGASGLGVSGAGGDGLYATGGSLTLAGSHMVNNSGSGIELSDDVEANITDVVIQDNGGSGLLCDGGGADPSTSTVDLNSCSGYVSDNGDGDFNLINGCEVDWSCTHL